jgi:hypothetical protein
MKCAAMREPLTPGTSTGWSATSSIRASTPTTSSCPTATSRASIGITRKYAHFFEDCLGAVDGTHLPYAPPVADADRYRDRKSNARLDSARV